MKALIALVSAAVICGAAVAAEEKPYEPDENTVLLLHLDEGEGEVAKDSSSAGLNAKLEAAPRRPTWEKEGKFGACLRFDGDNADHDGDKQGDADSLVFNCGGKLAPYPALTVEMWIKPERLPDQQAVFNRDGGGRYNLFLMRNRILFNMVVTKPEAKGKRTWAQVVSDPLVQPNQWQHVAAVCDGENLILYHNGTKVKTAPLAGRPTKGASHVTIARDGDRRPTSIRGFKGLIDEIRVSKVARDAKEFSVAAEPAVK